VELRDVSANAVNALTKHCPNLIDIGFLDCLKVDEVALGNVASVLFLLATGTSKMKWRVVSHLWHKDWYWSKCSFYLDYYYSPGLKVLCAMNSSRRRQYVQSDWIQRKIVTCSFHSYFFEGLAFLFADTLKREKDVLLEWKEER